MNKLFKASKRASEKPEASPEVEPAVFVRVSDLIDRWKNNEFQNIVVMAGAGISVSCGIPDFRTKGTGLYDNLQKYKLPYPEAVFDLDYFQKTEGEPFYKLAKEVFPDNFAPSPAHAFIRLLMDKGVLRRCFTQNIDTLERASGISPDLLVEAHGSFGSASCIQCKTEYEVDKCQEKIKTGDVPIYCPSCSSLVKPDIVFFGEDMPERFFKFRKTDFAKADLLIIMGTSLKVQPFAGLIDYVKKETPRLLINLEPVGVTEMGAVGLRIRQADNTRDYMIEGRCDDGVRALADALGWRDDLETLVEKFNSKVGVSKRPVDPTVSFPFMKGGLEYNWRRTHKKKKSVKLVVTAPPQLAGAGRALPKLDDEIQVESEERKLKAMKKKGKKAGVNSLAKEMEGHMRL